MKKVLFALAGLAIAASALAELAKYKDWDKTPEAYFLTPEERAEWKKVSTDDDAEKFIGLYFAKRGGESFRDGMRRRIAAADEQFKGRRQKGSESARGRLFVVLGNPSRVLQSRAGGGTDGEATPDTGLGAAGEVSAEGIATVQTWVYDKDKFDPSWGLGDLKLRVALDPQRGMDELQNSGAADKAIATIASKSIVNPNVTVGTPPSAGAPAPSAGAPAPSAGAPPPSAGAPAASAPRPATQPPATAPAPPATGAPPAAGGAPSAAPPPAPTMPLPARVKSALTGASPTPGDAAFWSGTFRSPSGDNFLALQYYLASNKPAFSSGAPLKFGGVVQDESGKEVESFWEDATFSEVSESGRKDRVLDRSVALPPGTYKGTFGLFTAEGQPPVSTSTVDFKIEPKSEEFAVSPLILSAGLVPLTKRPGPNDPFVFGTEKPIKVEPKGDRLFSKQDSLWYFYTVANPALPADAGAPAPSPAPAPATTPQAGAPAPAPTAEAKPRVMTRINVQKDGKDAFAPFTGPAELQPIGSRYYGTGTEIPLASFEPGHYTFVIAVRDLNAARGSAASKGIERKEDFVVLMPDGSVPPKGAPKAAPAPKPTPKKP